MQKILLIIIAVVLLGGGVWYFYNGNNSSSNQATTQTNNSKSESSDGDLAKTESESEPLSGIGSLASVLGFGNKVRCNFSSADNDHESTGVFYTDGERLRVEMTATSPEGSFNSNMINDGEFIYTWGDTPEGMMAIKMVNPETSETDTTVHDTASPSPDSNSYVDVDEEVSYDCDRWTVDNSVFTPPSDVEFMDMAAMMQGALEGMPEGFAVPEGMEDAMGQ